MISLKDLKIKKFECLLLHDPDSLLSKNGDEIYTGMKNMKINGFTNKIAKGIMRILPQKISLKLTKMILKKGINKGNW